MWHELSSFLMAWAITALSLWAASQKFAGPMQDDTASSIVSARLLGLAHAVVKPLLIVLTLPLRLLSFGLFVLVIDALMMLLVARLVKGFRVSSFRTTFIASTVSSMLSIAIAIGLLSGGSPSTTIRMLSSGAWI